MSGPRHHSLAVVQTRTLLYLGLRSLREVSAGRVLLKDNAALCYTRPDQFSRLFRSQDQSVSLRNNMPADVCGERPRDHELALHWS